MKIRTKVVFISSAAVLGALLLMSGIIFQIVYNSRENEAYLKAEQKSYMMQKEFHSWMNKAKEIEFGRNMAAYYLKSQQEGYFICVEKSPQIEGGQTEEIFNNTIFSPEELLKLDYSADNSLGEHARFFYEDREYLIFRSTYESDIVLLSLEEITYVKNEMKTLAAVLGASVIVIVTLTILVLSTVLRRVFLPLQQLNISAKQMTEGVYNKRVEVEETDEIG